MEFIVTENTEIVLDGNRFLLEEGDKFFYSKSAAKELSDIWPRSEIKEIPGELESEEESYW